MPHSSAVEAYRPFRAQIRLFAGEGLLAANSFRQDLSDPVCQITNRRTKETVWSDHLQNTVNPRWHQSLYMSNVLLDDVLDVVMWSDNGIKPKTIIGCTHISVRHALQASAGVIEKDQQLGRLFNSYTPSQYWNWTSAGEGALFGSEFRQNRSELNLEKNSSSSLSGSFSSSPGVSGVDTDFMPYHPEYSSRSNYQIDGESTCPSQKDGVQSSLVPNHPNPASEHITSPYSHGHILSNDTGTSFRYNSKLSEQNRVTDAASQYQRQSIADVVSPCCHSSGISSTRDILLRIPTNILSQGSASSLESKAGNLPIAGTLSVESSIKSHLASERFASFLAWNAQLFNLLAQMPCSYNLCIGAVGSESWKGSVVVGVIDPRFPPLDRYLFRNKFKMFRNLKTLVDASHVIENSLSDQVCSTMLRLGNLTRLLVQNVSVITGAGRDMSEARSILISERDVYPTWKVDMCFVDNAFGSIRHPWNRNHAAAQTVFQTPGARAAVKAAHAALYGGTGLSSLIGIENFRHKLGAVTGAVLGGCEFLELINWGRRDGQRRNFTYVLMPRRLYFSETGPNILQDLASKHAMHANAAEEVVYAGEMHVREEWHGNIVRRVLVLDNNSGTYAPSPAYLPLLKIVFEFNFPSLDVEVFAFDDPDLKVSKPL